MALYHISTFCQSYWWSPFVNAMSPDFPLWDGRRSGGVVLVPAPEMEFPRNDLPAR